MKSVYQFKGPHMCVECHKLLKPDDSRAFFDLPDGGFYFTHEKCAYKGARIYRVNLRRRFVLWVKRVLKR